MEYLIIAVVGFGMGFCYEAIKRWLHRRRQHRKMIARRTQLVDDMCKRLYIFTGDDSWLRRYYDHELYIKKNSP